MVPPSSPALDGVHVTCAATGALTTKHARMMSDSRSDVFIALVAQNILRVLTWLICSKVTADEIVRDYSASPNLRRTATGALTATQSFTTFLHFSAARSQHHDTSIAGYSIGSSRPTHRRQTLTNAAMQLSIAELESNVTSARHLL